MKPLENNFPNLRPSIETGLHGIIPRKYVVHLHPIGLLSTLVRPNIKEKIEKFYSCDEYLLVPYKKPGEGLTQYLNSARKIRNLPKLIFLANHGVVISGETLSDVEISLSKIVDTFSQNSAPRVQVKLDLIQQLTAKTTWHLPIFDEVQLLAQDKAILNLALSGILFPDHIVFLGNSIHSVPAKAGDLISWLSQPTIKDLPYLIVPQLGVLTNPNLSQDGHELLLAWCRILREIPEGEKINYLHADEINDIYQWEAEAYRRRLSIDQ
jgi:rhamnose utilization protein RhaD (predicted bifunctional aldolase and dehydrogenase)